jgi:hypothetical protein
MANWNKIGKELIKDGIFVRFPELIPAVGEPNYWNGEHSKLLLVGESNYFKDDLESKSVFIDAEKWYHGKNCPLIPEEKKKDVSNWVGNSRHNKIFKSMKTILDEVGIKNYKSDLLQEAAYYNYFLRPASVTKGNYGFEKNCEPIDCEVSYSALCGIIEEIKPNIVIFVSKYSHDKFMDFNGKEKNRFENVVIDFVNHFSSPRTWEHENGNGRQKFEKLLREHWVKKNPMNEIVFKKLQTIHSELKEKFKVEKEQECFSDKGSYLSCLYFNVNDSSFCCETGVKINDVDFWTCFYKTENSKEITALEGKGYKLIPNLSNDKIVKEIEKQIRQIIEEVSKTS